jgi:hypothetical protein
MDRQIWKLYLGRLVKIHTFIGPQAIVEVHRSPHYSQEPEIIGDSIGLFWINSTDLDLTQAQRRKFYQAQLRRSSPVIECP